MQARAERSASGVGVLVKFEILDRAGQRLHDGSLTGEFPDREAAVEAINLHLQQFEQTGHDRTGNFWWGRSLCEPCQETRFLVLPESLDLAGSHRRASHRRKASS